MYSVYFYELYYMTKANVPGALPSDAFNGSADLAKIPTKKGFGEVVKGNELQFISREKDFDGRGGVPGVVEDVAGEQGAAVADVLGEQGDGLSAIVGTSTETMRKRYEKAIELFGTDDAKAIEGMLTGVRVEMEGEDRFYGPNGSRSWRQCIYGDSKDGKWHVVLARRLVRGKDGVVRDESYSIRSIEKEWLADWGVN